MRIPARLAQVLQQAGSQDAGIIDQDVEAAGLADRAGHQGLDLDLAADVARKGEGPPTGGGDLGLDGVE